MPDDKPSDDKFTDLLTRLVRVPKEEIDERERDYRDTRAIERPAKPRGIVQPPTSK